MLQYFLLSFVSIFLSVACDFLWFLGSFSAVFCRIEQLLLLLISFVLHIFNTPANSDSFSVSLARFMCICLSSLNKFNLMVILQLNVFSFMPWHFSRIYKHTYTPISEHLNAQLYYCFSSRSISSIDLPTDRPSVRPSVIQCHQIT